MFIFHVFSLIKNYFKYKNYWYKINIIRKYFQYESNDTMAI
jgi:hypothetical protein